MFLFYPISPSMHWLRILCGVTEITGTTGLSRLGYTLMAAPNIMMIWYTKLVIYSLLGESYNRTIRTNDINCVTFTNGRYYNVRTCNWAKGLLCLPNRRVRFDKARFGRWSVDDKMDEANIKLIWVVVRNLRWITFEIGCQSRFLDI